MKEMKPSRSRGRSPDFWKNRFVEQTLSNPVLKGTPKDPATP